MHGRLRRTPVHRASGATCEPRPLTSASRRLDSQLLPAEELARGLRLELGAVQQVAPARAVVAAICARWSVPAALGQQRIGHGLERLELAHDAVAAALRARAAAATADRVLHDA